MHRTYTAGPISVFPVMATPSSAIVVTNRTAFPLNIALVRVAPLQHTNALEPGESWTTTSPSHIPFLSDLTLPWLLPHSFKFYNLHLFTVQLLDKWSNRLASSTTTIEIRFDHENNRFCRDAALRTLTSGFLRLLGLLFLFGTLALTLGTQLLLYARAVEPRHLLNVHDVRRHVVGLSFAVLGFVLLLCSRIGTMICDDAPPAPYISITAARSPNSDKSVPPRRNILLSIPVATSSLRPSSSSAFSRHSHPPVSMFSTASIASGPRAHKHLAVIWRLGRLVLWDVSLDQEVLPRTPTWW